jgi:hypothetical protein
MRAPNLEVALVVGNGCDGFHGAPLLYSPQPQKRPEREARLGPQTKNLTIPGAYAPPHEFRRVEVALAGQLG